MEIRHKAKVLSGFAVPLLAGAGAKPTMKRSLLLAALTAAMWSAQPAKASVIMTIEQVGNNVVASGSGTINLTGLTDTGSFDVTAGIAPSQGVVLLGGGTSYDFWTGGGLSGPSSFGSGGVTLASSESGDYLAVGGAFQLYILSGYTSGTPISGTATFDLTTLASLGITPGVYSWTWGTGQNADSLTLFAGVQPSAVPEPTSVGLMSVGLAGGALLWARMRRRATVPQQ
jgi:hypothetical protein